MARTRTFRTGIPLLALLLVAAIPYGSRAAEMKITLSGYSAAGAVSAMGNAIGAAILKNNPGSIFSYEPGQGGANEIKVSRGDTEMGLSSSLLLRPAMKGEEPFSQKLGNLCALSFLHTNDMMVIADERSGVESVDELKTKPLRVGTHQKNSLMELGARDFLKLSGITYDLIEKNGGKHFMSRMSIRIDQMRNRQLDVIVEPMPTPTGLLIDASNTIPLKVLPLDPKVIQQAIDELGYRPVTIPKTAYPFLHEDLNSFAVDNLLIASTDMSDDMAYAIVKAMYDNLDDLRKVGFMKALTPELMVQVGKGIPLHPGAAKFYREKGLIQ